jgi:NAD(P)H-nitrite reductase large subunit
MARDRRTVKMCVCHRKKFDAVLQLAREQECETLDDIIAADIAGKGCGMCHPYIKKALRTGEIRFIPGDIYVNSKSPKAKD